MSKQATSTLVRSVSPATTEYRVLAQFDNASLALVKPHTGVKHQIRVHLGFGLNTPILGDHKYSHIRSGQKLNFFISLLFCKNMNPLVYTYTVRFVQLGGVPDHH